MTRGRVACFRGPLIADSWQAMAGPRKHGTLRCGGFSMSDQTVSGPTGLEPAAAPRPVLLTSRPVERPSTWRAWWYLVRLSVQRQSRSHQMVWVALILLGLTATIILLNTAAGRWGMNHYRSPRGSGPRFDQYLQSIQGFAMACRGRRPRWPSGRLAAKLEGVAGTLGLLHILQLDRVRRVHELSVAGLEHVVRDGCAGRRARIAGVYFGC